jgi:exopolysaccharide biosynthesis predicted pyruvyltransferase EpsI
MLRRDLEVTDFLLLLLANAIILFSIFTSFKIRTLPHMTSKENFAMLQAKAKEMNTVATQRDVLCIVGGGNTSELYCQKEMAISFI